MKTLMLALLIVIPSWAVLTPGALSKSGLSTTASMTIITGVATGGTAPYTYQWQRSPYGTGTWATVGSNSTTLADTGLTNGTSYDYRVNITDNVAATATSSTFSAATLIAMDNALVSKTPGAWYSSGANSWVNSNRGGAHLGLAFTGSGSVIVDSYTQGVPSGAYSMAYSIDGGARTIGLAPVISTTNSQVTIATGLSSGSHTVDFWLEGLNNGAQDCWTGGIPGASLTIWGIQLDAGFTLSAPVALTSKMLFVGDSITAGQSASANIDYIYTYAAAVAAALNSEPSWSAYPTTGWNRTGTNNVPPLATALVNYYASTPRTLTDLFTRVLINMGTNDTGSFGPVVASTLTTARAALGSTSKLYVLMPFNNATVSAMTTGMTTYCGTLGSAVTVQGTQTYQTCANDTKTYFLNLGADGSAGLAGSVSFQSPDGLHPNGFTHNRLAGLITVVIKAIENVPQPSPVVAH